MTTLTGMTYRLVMRAELLQLLGISPTRLVQITTRPEYEFPAPVADLIGGKIWDLSDVETWANQRGRTLHPLAAAVGE
jgi:predicted DNA-binding transcriptional regulator AlpA